MESKSQLARDGFRDEKCGAAIQHRQNKLTVALQLRAQGMEIILNAFNTNTATYDLAEYERGEALRKEGKELAAKYRG